MNGYHAGPIDQLFWWVALSWLVFCFATWVATFVAYLRTKQIGALVALLSVMMLSPGPYFFWKGSQGKIQEDAETFLLFFFYFFPMAGVSTAMLTISMYLGFGWPVIIFELAGYLLCLFLAVSFAKRLRTA